MNRQGKQIFYERDTGYVFFVIPEMEGAFAKRTLDEEIALFKPLQDRIPGSFGVIELEYRQYAEDFTNAISFRVNPQIMELEFSYPDPNAPAPPEPVYQPPLTEQVAELKGRTEAAELAIMALMDAQLTL